MLLNQGKQKIRTFEIVQYVTGWVDGDINDWPANIQDAVHKALERKAKEVELPLTIVASYCDVDYGETKEQDKFYLRVIASEIIAADSRFYKDAQDQMREIISQITHKKTRH